MNAQLRNELAPIRCLQSVSVTENGKNPEPIFRLEVQFAPDPRNVHVQGARGKRRCGAPDRFHDVVA